MDTIIKLLLLSYFILYVKVRAEGGPDAMQVCLLPVIPQDSGKEVINLGWILSDFFSGDEACRIRVARKQAVTACNARFSGEGTRNHLSRDTDDKRFFNLCPNSTASGMQFLYIPNITSALLTEMQTLGECLLKQAFTPKFCLEDYQARR